MDDLIDPNKLSIREMLIVIHKKVEGLEKSSVEQRTKQETTDVQLAILNTKMMMWAGFMGFLSGIGGSVITFLITNHK